MTVAGGSPEHDDGSGHALRRPVTIVVPIYDDLDGLLACLQSLIEHVDLTFDRVVLANDAGPNADVIETAVLKQIHGIRGFEYHRNDQNLGFLGNCNNVVLNLDHSGNDVMLLNSDTVVTGGFIDEMSAVLYLADSHGVVAPRSNNATIATIPHRRRNIHAPMPLSRTSAVHAVVAPLLPRFTVAPVAMGFCFLIRRELVDEFGLFDERFAPGYGEENDFCLRINEHGYSSLLANRALVFHTGSTSFSGDRGPSLRFAHEKVLIERYPHYVGALGLYQAHGRDPIDNFADTFLPGDDKIRLAIDVLGKTTDDLLRDIDRFAEVLGDDVVVTVIAPRNVVHRARSRMKHGGVTDRRHVNAVFDVAMGLGSIESLTRLIRLNELAPRWLLVDEGPSRDRRWSQRVSRYQVEAVERIARRFADEWVRDDEAQTAVEAVRRLAHTPIDVDNVRARWDHLVDAGSAAGLTKFPQRASFQRRLALLIGARSPRFSRFARALLKR